MTTVQIYRESITFRSLCMVPAVLLQFMAQREPLTLPDRGAIWPAGAVPHCGNDRRLHCVTIASFARQ